MLVADALLIVCGLIAAMSAVFAVAAVLGDFLGRWWDRRETARWEEDHDDDMGGTMR